MFTKCLMLLLFPLFVHFPLLIVVEVAKYCQLEFTVHHDLS